MSPLEDRVLILPEAAKKTTDAGIVIPDQIADKNKPPIGTIAAIGPGLPSKQHFEEVGADDQGVPVYQIVTMPVKVGDKVMYGKSAGLPVKDPKTNVEYLLMRVSDVWMVM